MKFVKSINKMRIVIILLFLNATCSTILAYSSSEYPTLYLSPKEEKLTHTSQRFSLDLMIDNIENLWAWAIGVSWDPDVIRFVDVIEGPFLKDTGYTIFTSRPALIGKVPEITCTKLKIEGVDGSGILATMTFELMKETNGTKIHITESHLREGDLELVTVDMPHNLDNSTIRLLYQEINALGGENINANEDEKIFLNASKSTGDNLTYTWNFIDYNGAKELLGKEVEYTFTRAGKYFLKLTVTDGDTSSTDIVTARIQDVTDPVIILDIGGLSENNSTLVGEILYFNASKSYDPEEGQTWIYEWDFGDGSQPDHGDEVVYAYNEPGEYLMTLNLTDSHGNDSIYTQKITVSKNIEKNTFDLTEILLIIIVIAVIVVIIRTFYLSKRREKS
jgi:hypothetical protein